MKELHSYIGKQWINGLFPISSWCVYGKETRTNNDVEGWHHKLNDSARAIRNVHDLVQILQDDAKQGLIINRLITEGQTLKERRKSTVTKNNQMNEVWERYKCGDLNPKQLLVELALL